MMLMRRQVVALADGEVVGVVGGRDLDRAGAELGLDPVVGDDGDLAAHRAAARTRLAVQVLVALVGRVDGDGGVAEHGLRAGGGDDESSPVPSASG